MNAGKMFKPEIGWSGRKQKQKLIRIVKYFVQFNTIENPRS